MFDVGFSELVLLAVIGLLVLGPKRLPRAASELGKWAGSARRSARDFLRQLERETGFKEVVERPRPKLRVVPTRRDPGRDDPRSV